MNYFLFFYFQVIFKKIGHRYADLIIDMDEISDSIERKKELRDKVYGMTGLDIDFCDMRIKKYPDNIHVKYCFPEIEKIILDLTGEFDIELREKA